MGSRERPFFDLNEIPVEEEEIDVVSSFQPLRAIPSSNAYVPNLFATPAGPQRISNNNAFSHANSASGFQPFVRQKNGAGSSVGLKQTRSGVMSSEVLLSLRKSNDEDAKAASQMDLNCIGVQQVEKEEGEWSSAEGSADPHGSFSRREHSVTSDGLESLGKGIAIRMDHHAHGVKAEIGSQNDEIVKNENSDSTALGLDLDTKEQNNRHRSSEENCKVDLSMDGQEGKKQVLKPREVKGVEASHALKCANNPGKRSRVDQQKEAMLGKKRSRQTMFLNLDDVKQAGSIKASTPRKQKFPAPVTTRTVKEAPTVPPTEHIAEKQSQPMHKDAKQDF